MGLHGSDDVLRVWRNVGRRWGSCPAAALLMRLVDQNIASWNQALLWLRRVNTLRGGQAPTG
jgi:hypothetical protein